MRTRMFGPILVAALGLGAHELAAQQQLRTVQVRTPKGVLEGVVSADNKVRTFKGIPFAAPPVGDLRWQPPQPAPSWTGVRKASEYGARCMQARIYSDMIFHDDGPSEDCLYLNLWMPEAAMQAAAPKLPVMVWIFGGGFAAGSTSEPRQDGGNLSKKGVLVVSMNYRLGIFGFYSHPELTKESPQHASGNYGLMDQLAALKWVHDNIALFGGDPNNVTIFGESAGSMSVSALVASPLAKGLFQKAIGESGAMFGANRRPKTLKENEEAGMKFAQESLGTTSLAELRAKPASEVLDAAQKDRGLFWPNVDGYYLPRDPAEIYAAGDQSHVALLAGWNLDEGNARTLLGRDAPTPENFAAHAKEKFGGDADEFLKAYGHATEAEARRSAADYGGDDFIAFGTWKWIETQLKTGGSPVYRYKFENTLPLSERAAANPNAQATAPHASEIEFVFMMLDSKQLPWRPDDRKVSDMMATYWSNFAKTGDPNGEGLPRWPAYNSRDGYQVMHLVPDAHAAADEHRDRYLFLDKVDSRAK